MNKLVPFGILVLCMCVGAGLRISNHHEPRWLSKNGQDCAMVRYSEDRGAWTVEARYFPGTFINKDEAVNYARKICGGGDIKIANKRQ